MTAIRSLVSICAVLVSPHLAVAAPLDLAGYLAQVRGSHQGVIGDLKAVQGGLDVSRQSRLLLTPTLFADAHYIDDHTPQTVPAFQGDETQMHSFQLGVKQLTTFGMQAQFSYLFQRTEISDVNPALLPFPHFYQAGPVLAVEQSLWRNGFGRQTRADQEQYEAQSLSGAYASSFDARTALFTAEAAYYRLALARESIVLERQSFERAEKIRDWNQRRVKLQLGDEADLLQAQAALELRRLELQQAVDEERSASRAFNASRQVDSDEAEELAAVDPEAVLALAAPVAGAERDDVRAARETERASMAGATSQLELLLPDIKVYAQYGFNGRDQSPRETAWDSWTANHPAYTIGVKLTAPLDLPLIFKSRNGQAQLSEAARLGGERKAFEAQSEWKELEKSFGESKHRLTLWRSVEKAQGAKLAREKTLFSRGRSTAFQVLTFEQDFIAAQKSRVQAENDVVRTVARMRVFGTGQIGAI